ncbi:MAG: hypothetical protein WA906_00340, partial [Pacificimonas sp.]
AVKQRPFAHLRKFDKPIRTLAGATFTLYLFHRPVLLLFAGPEFTWLQSPLGTVFLFLAIVGASLLLSQMLEGKVTRWLRARLSPPRKTATA